MAAALVETMQALSLTPEETSSPQSVTMLFKVSGLTTFELEVDPATAVRDVKKLAAEMCNIEPEHMRFIYKDQVLKESDSLENYEVDGKAPVHVAFTAGHGAMLGGGKPAQKQEGNPFAQPVRGLPGSKGDRTSRMSKRRGGMGLIRKYGIMMKRQEFREKAEEIGFRKYR
mmetsp:Transcript_31575/g.69135  ORF Transcript_31575/g.69135 Transcript_31575/m.69135 type:complete len:171 (-) Transcript_31575:81-593(-)